MRQKQTTKGQGPVFMRKIMFAEALGTFILVSVLCGTMVGAARLSGLGVGLTGIALAAGFTLACVFYLFAPISGAHVNPAVSAGAWLERRISTKQLALYIAAQLAGAVLAALALFLIFSFQPGFQPLEFAANGYGRHSPGGYLAPAVFAGEALQTFVFVLMFLRFSQADVPRPIGTLSIGFAYSASHFATFAISGTSLNPARSTAMALFAEGWALDQLWLFWLAPVLGGLLAGLVCRILFGGNSD
ncbi:MAG: aquaporin [Alphaproteobacteria bacterium]|nr:aquaporin [Alphaproteobacteria bacterium]